MSKVNSKKMVKGNDPRVSKTVRLAGGAGKRAAVQDPEALLRRCVMACLLWEDMAYESGATSADNIASLIPQVEPGIVADICIEARIVQKLRHTPLFIAREMARIPAYNKYLDVVLPKIITRADMLADFVNIYYDKKGSRQGNSKAKLTNKVKKGLAAAFNNFHEYHFAKYDRKGPVRIRDVMFMVHPKAETPERATLYKMIAEDTLPIPLTWETELSAGKDKCATFTKLIKERKIGGMAFLRNLRNIEQSGVKHAVVASGFENLHGANLLPLNYIAAFKHSQNYSDEIEKAMLANLGSREKLPGHTIFVLDTSGSMCCKVSAKSELDRIDAGVAMMILAREICEQVTLYVTGTTTHQIRNLRGFALSAEVKNAKNKAGYGGIYTSECCAQIAKEHPDADRVIIFSDSQDCGCGDAPARPHGKTNYIVDVSAHKHGVNYKGNWTAEISGWSEHFLSFILAQEGLTLAEVEG